MSWESGNLWRQVGAGVWSLPYPCLSFLICAMGSTVLSGGLECNVCERIGSTDALDNSLVL